MAEKVKQKIDLKVVLSELAQTWREKLKEIGLCLIKLGEAGEPVDLIIREVLEERNGMSAATARCARRWAAGDFGDDQQALILIGKVSHSLLQNMTTEAIAHVTKGSHTIASPDEMRVVSKPLASMSRLEVSRNITVTGFRSIPASVGEVPTFRACRAVSYEIVDHEMVFVSRGPEGLKMRVPVALLRQAVEEIESDTSVAA